MFGHSGGKDVQAIKRKSFVMSHKETTRAVRFVFGKKNNLWGSVVLLAVSVQATFISSRHLPLQYPTQDKNSMNR
jgi:hypothetical protein